VIRLARLVAAVFVLFVLMAQPVAASPAPSVQSLLLTASDMPVGWASYPLNDPVAQGCWSPLQDLLARRPGS
jgi:hypothetical protein